VEPVSVKKVPPVGSALAVGVAIGVKKGK